MPFLIMKTAKVDPLKVSKSLIGLVVNRVFTNRDGGINPAGSEGLFILRGCQPGLMS